MRTVGLGFVIIALFAALLSPMIGMWVCTELGVPTYAATGLGMIFGPLADFVIFGCGMLIAEIAPPDPPAETF